MSQKIEFESNPSIHASVSGSLVEKVFARKAVTGIETLNSMATSPCLTFANFPLRTISKDRSTSGAAFLPRLFAHSLYETDRKLAEAMRFQSNKPTVVKSA